MDQRIKSIRTAEGLTQTEFGARLGVRGTTITNYETGTRTPSDAVILSICREFHVSEHWLRTGEGEMYRKQTPNEELAGFMGNVLAEGPDFRYRLLQTLSRLKPEEWALLERIAAELKE